MLEVCYKRIRPDTPYVERETVDAFGNAIVPLLVARTPEWIIGLRRDPRCMSVRYVVWMRFVLVGRCLEDGVIVLRRDMDCGFWS
jgi:hypothetical protein